MRAARHPDSGGIGTGYMMKRAAAHLDVALVNMPFGALNPSLGLGLLQASLSGVRTRVFYLTLPFAERLGEELYHWVARGNPSETALLGEWIFSGSLFESNAEAVEPYIDRVLRDREKHEPVPNDIVRQIIRTREMAPAFVEECLAELRQWRPRIVGFTSMFQQHVASLALAKRVKATLPGTCVLFGGPNCEGVMGWELSRQFPFIDAVVSGEADHQFGELVQSILDGHGVPQLEGVYTHATARKTACLDPAKTNLPTQNLDALPYPDYDDFFEQWARCSIGNDYKPRLLFETSRGCWWGERHHCTFCGLNGSTMAYRSKSAARALDELEWLTTRYPGHSVMAVDNILDMRYFKDFLPALAERKLSTTLFYEVKSNLRKDQVRMLRDAGISEIQPGIESLSNTVLELMRKGVTGLQNIQLLKWCAEYGLWPDWNFIWGFPGESPEEYDRMASLVPQLTHLPPPKVAAAIRLDRFSPNFFQGTELGLTDISPCPTYRDVYPFDPAALANLAYYFTFRYRDGRDVESYTKPLADEITCWQVAYEQSELFYVKKDEALWIWDLRPSATQPLTVLTGLDRTLYLACDGVRAVASLARPGAGAGVPVTIAEVEDALGPLVDRGLMVRDGDAVLSLAIPRG